jgi:hypothetical protein
MKHVLFVFAALVLVVSSVQLQVRSESRTNKGGVTAVTNLALETVSSLGTGAPECVCSCGVDCGSGRIICTTDCPCSEDDCRACIADCCVAAAKAEGCVQ